MDSYDEFALSIYSVAKNVCAKYNLPAKVVTAQACIESAWGSNIIGDYNYFGRKWGGWGEYIEEETQEDDGEGNWYTIVAKFQDYTSLEQAIEDWCDLMNYVSDDGTIDYKQYADSYIINGNLEDFVRGIASIYATDINYADKILQTISALEEDKVFD